MGKCAKTKGKARKLECYARSSAKWTAGKLKSGVERIGSFSGEQGKKHKYAFGLFFLAVIGVAFVAGSLFLAYGTVSNPTAADAAYSVTWKDSKGNVILTGNTGTFPYTLNGTVTCDLTSTPTGVVESASVSIYGVPQTIPIPFYVKSVRLELYQKSGTGYSPIVYKTCAATCQTTNYASSIVAWGANWVNSMSFGDPNAIIPIPTVVPNPGNPPFSSSAWKVVFDTTTVPNAEYKFTLVVQWALVTTTPAISLPTSPPSLSSSSGSRILSFFSFGDGGEPVEVTLPIAFIAMVVVAVVAVLYLKRR